MKKFLLILLCLLPLSLAAKKYTLKYNKAITEIVNTSEADIELIFSPEKAGNVVYTSSEVEAPLRFTFSNGTLTVATARKSNYKVSKVKVYYSSYITTITSKGTGDFEANEINAPVDFRINNSGTGDVDIKKINVKSLAIKNSGTGDVDIDGGKTVILTIRNSGTGDVDAKIKSSESEISNSGTGDVTGVRSSSKYMSLSNCGTGKIVINGSQNIGDVKIARNCDRNIRFIK